MNTLIKLSGRFLIILCLLAIFTSCDKGSDDEEYIYVFGLTSAINSKNEEMEAIELAYWDAYKNDGLRCNGSVLRSPQSTRRRHGRFPQRYGRRGLLRCRQESTPCRRATHSRYFLRCFCLSYIYIRE